MLIQTSWKPLIMLAWGPRRVSSRAGDGIAAYPGSLGAHHKLWLQWIMTGARRWVFGPTYIVIGDDPEGGASSTNARRDQFVAQMQADAARAARLAMVPTPEEIAEKMALRNELRAQKRFAEADAIRDELVSRGAVIADERLT